MSGIADATKLIDSIGDSIDKNIESGEERQQSLTDRHKVDMSSDSWLSKNIRPLTLIFLMVCQTAIIGAAIFGTIIDPWIVGQVGTLLFGAFGFYFNSKKGERMMAKRIEGATKIEEMKIKAQLKENRRDNKLDRKLARKNK